MILKSILDLNIDLYLSDLTKGCLTILALEILWDMIKTLCFYERGWFIISSYKGKNSYIWENYFHGFKTRPDKSIRPSIGHDFGPIRSIEPKNG